MRIHSFQILEKGLPGLPDGSCLFHGPKKFNAFPFEDLEVEKLQAMIPDTITTKADTTQKAESSADFHDLLKTKHDEKVEVELAMDLTQTIKFGSGDKAKCKCNVFSVKTGTNEKVQFLWKKRKCNVVDLTTKKTPLSHERQNGKKKGNHHVAFGPTVCCTSAQVAAANAADAAAVKTNNTSPGTNKKKSRPVSPSPIQENKR